MSIPEQLNLFEEDLLPNNDLSQHLIDSYTVPQVSNLKLSSQNLNDLIHNLENMLYQLKQINQS